MTFQRFPESLIAPLSLGQGVPALSTFTERAALDPATGRTLMYLAVVKLATGCAPPPGPDPVIRLRAGSGPLTNISRMTPVHAGPATDEPVAIATLASADNVYVVEVELLQTGSTWAIELEHSGPAMTHEFTWVVSDNLAEACQPWIHTSTAPVDFTVHVGESQTRTVPIANRGTGPLTLTNPVGQNLGGGFVLVDIAPRTLKPHECATARIIFTGPFTTGAVSLDFAVGSNDTSGGTQSGHNRTVHLVATTSLAAPPPVVHRIEAPDSHPGEPFTIVGTNLVVAGGDDVTVVFTGPVNDFFDPEQYALRAPLTAPTDPSAVRGLVPDIGSSDDSETYRVTLTRIDGQTAVVAEEFWVAIL